MTIKLLTPRDLTIGGRTVTYPAGALVTLDAATETGLINSKEATATLTGGIAYTPPVPSGQPVPLTVIPSAGGIDIYAFARYVSGIAVAHTLLADSVGLAQTGLQRLDYARIEKGSLRIGDKIRITLTGQKNGASDTCAFSVRAGADNSPTDAAIVTGPTMTTTNTAVGTQMMFRVVSDTTLRPIGSTATVNSLASTSNGSLKENVTIPSISNYGFYVGMYASMTGGSEVPTATEFMIEVIPGGA